MANSFAPLETKLNDQLSKDFFFLFFEKHQRTPY